MFKVEIDFDTGLQKHGKRCRYTIIKPKNPYQIESEYQKKNTSDVFCIRHRKRVYYKNIYSWE